jgi:hypothetical protein
VLRSSAFVLVLVALSVASARPAELQLPPADYPLCKANSLAGFPWIHPAFGKKIPGIALRNMTLETCRVAGFPRLRAYGDAGQILPIDFVRVPFIDTRIYAYSVRPGAAVFFTMYGKAPRNEFDRTCTSIAQVDVRVPQDDTPIDVTISTGTCGGRISYSQMFPVSELR